MPPGFATVSEGATIGKVNPKHNMVRFALLGVGRIGRLHAANIIASPYASLSCVFDVRQDAAHDVAEEHSVPAETEIDAVLSKQEVDAVLIATSTDSHVDLITASARSGKAVLCEKPIDLDIGRVNKCYQDITRCDVPVQIGFNRRFDPTHRAVRDAVCAGQVGRVEQIVITSRDPMPPPREYIKVSGGLFRDMMIHDFDLARFLSGEEFVEVSAAGNALVDPEIAELGDVDTAMVVMRSPAGVQCHINCSRRAVYGYDQRVEVFGSQGMTQSDNPRNSEIVRHTANQTGVRDVLQHFFLDRYRESYVRELEAFIEVVEKGLAPPVTFEDGRRALMLADAAEESMQTGQIVEVEY